MVSETRTLAGQICRAVFVACVLTVLGALAPAVSSAAQVTLAWDPNTDPDLAGYKLYYGTSSGSYQLSVDVGNRTSYTLVGLLEGQIYYFAATAYNLSLAESGFSNEVTKATPDVTPPTVSMTAPAAGVTVVGTVTVSASATDNVGVVGVQFTLDGTNLGAAVTASPYSISWNTTLVADGAHTLIAVARDAAGNTAAAAVSVTVDNTPPLISTVSASSISSSAGTITWVTNEASDSQVEYGLTTAYGSATALNSALTTAHAVTLTALLATTTYHYRVKSRDAAGNLATSADFTLTTLAPPAVSITVNGSSVPITVAAGASFTVAVTNGPGNPWDWLALYQTGAGAPAYLDWFFLNGTKSVPAVGLTTATVTFTAPTTAGTYEVRFLLNNTVQRLGTTPTVTVAPPPPSVMVNGSSVPITVAAGASFTAAVTNGPGNPWDWLALYQTGAGAPAYLDWFFLNGTKSVPAVGLTTATVTFTAPTTAGTYEVRFLLNNTVQRLGTTPTVTVAPPPPPSVMVNGSSVPITVAAGASFTVAVTNGPGNPWDWLALYQTGAGAPAYLDWFFLNGTKSVPAVGLTTATVTFTAPTTAGTYEVRFLLNNTVQRLGTTPTVTVQ